MRRTKWHLPRWYILTHSTCLINWSYAVSPRSGGNKLYTTRESPAPNVISGSASCCRCWERLSVDLIFLSVWVSVRHVTICVHFWKGGARLLQMIRSLGFPCQNPLTTYTKYSTNTYIIRWMTTSRNKKTWLSFWFSANRLQSCTECPPIHLWAAKES